MTDLFSYAPDPSYPHSPGWSEPDTSRAAADSMKPIAGELQRKCLAALTSRPMTPDEIATHVGATPFAVRPRITELKALGKIVDTGMRRRNDSNRNAKVWRLA